MGSIQESAKPHAVFVPYPAQGHINPILKLAKILHFNGFHITFVLTHYNYNRLLKSKGPNSLLGFPHFRFETITDGLPDTDGDTTQDIPSLSYSTSKNCLVPFRNLLAKLNSEDSDVPPVSCIVSDGVMSFTVEAAEELGIPDVLFWTTSACGFMGYMHYPMLVKKGLTPLKDESYLTNGYLDTVLDSIPGMQNVQLRDFPSFMRTTDRKDIMLNFLLGEVERASRASAIIINTFDALEHHVLEAFSSIFSRVYSIGPLQRLLGQIPHNSLSSLDSSLWKEEPECLQWLSSKDPNSVVYVNFGSITVMTSQQLVEFAWGLANSKQNFLWVIRPDLVKGDSAIPSTEFIAETKERGLLASCCQQEQVLAHPSVGGFLTHSGWNSTIESVSEGVPMICWPCFAEQHTNCRFVCREWSIGMEIDSNVKRDEVEKLVRELMEGDNGKEMRRKAMEWKKKAEKATGSNGSSTLNLDKVIKEVLLPSKSGKIKY